MILDRGVRTERDMKSARPVSSIPQKVNCGGTESCIKTGQKLFHHNQLDRSARTKNGVKSEMNLSFRPQIWRVETKDLFKTKRNIFQHNWKDNVGLKKA